MAVSSFIRFYTRLLRLYPADFQNEFGEEMTAVFIQAIANHRIQSVTPSPWAM